MKQSKKVITNDESINAAEAKLGVSYPKELREMLKKRNGFYLGGFRFYPVMDKEDLRHTADDVVRENSNPVAGWKQYMPEGYVAIADYEGMGCLALSTKKDGKIYYWNNEMGEMEVYAENGIEFAEKIDKEEHELDE